MYKKEMDASQITELELRIAVIEHNLKEMVNILKHIHPESQVILASETLLKILVTELLKMKCEFRLKVTQE